MDNQLDKPYYMLSAGFVAALLIFYVFAMTSLLHLLHVPNLLNISMTVDILVVTLYLSITE
jgi:molybdopterin biosynthesis enzyme